MRPLIIGLITLAVGTHKSRACGDCFESNTNVEHVRHIRRSQPGALNATYGPTRPLEWGQVNFLHTTDTHGWLEGHLKEPNYGADWGDFVSFSEAMKEQADDKKVDLLIVDTGDLHDGTGLSDTTNPNGEIAVRIFERLHYDLLTIGNHELLLAEVAYQTFNEIAQFWGDKYLTSNVQILNPATNDFEYIGKPYKYLTTSHGLRIMAFGVLFNMTRNAECIKVIPAQEMILQDWFRQAVDYSQPIDMFLVLGHNPVRSSIGGTFDIIRQAIRGFHPDTPIQFFGGHTHTRDFAVLDESSTALESGRYCETLGWLSMSGFDENNSGWTGISPNIRGVPNPTRKATANSSSPFRFSRRYLDWNLATFEFHAPSSQTKDSGRSTTADTTKYREDLHLDRIYGCVPRDFCVRCVPFNTPGSIFPLLSQALAEVVVNETRKNIPRYLIANTGGVRLDMYKGPFTYDDFFTIMPSQNSLLYVPEVPCAIARTVLNELNGIDVVPSYKAISFESDLCVDPIITPLEAGNITDQVYTINAVTRRQVVDPTPGYTTDDDFGSDGDDTSHSPIEYLSIPNYYQATAGFGPEGCTGDVDVVFVDFATKHLLRILGPEYSSSNITHYIDSNYSIHDFLPEFVKRSQIFQAGMPDCK